MFTIIVFWQEEKMDIKKMNEYFTKQDELEILYLNECRENKENVDILLQEIGECVRAREAWRIFLVDNYYYQCCDYEKDAKLSGCCCGSDFCVKQEKCEKQKCGMGRNPFSHLSGMRNKKNELHMQKLINLIEKIGNPKLDVWVKPMDFFVIMVRDGEFFCNYEISVPNLQEEYWKVSSEFPANCRYFVYDMLYYGKKLYKRELYWLYSLMALLGSNELSMDQFLAGYMYRIEVVYSERKYHKHLHSLWLELEQEQKREIYEKSYSLSKSTLDLYPLIVENKGIGLQFDLNMAWKQKSIEQVEELLASIVEKSFAVSSESYKKQWETLREQVSKDISENREVCEEDKIKYETQLYDRTFIEQRSTIEVDEIDMNKEDVLTKLKELLNQYKILEGRKWNIGGMLAFLIISYIFQIFLLVISDISFCKDLLEYIQSGKMHGVFSFMDVGKVIYAAFLVLVSILCVFLVFGQIYLEQWRIRKRLWRMCISLDTKQAMLDSIRSEFLKSSRNVMLYWKRKHVLEKRQKNHEHLQDIYFQQKKKREELKTNIEILLKLEKENISALNKIPFCEKEQNDCFIGNKRAHNKNPFILRVRFIRIEERR